MDIVDGAAFANFKAQLYGMPSLDISIPWDKNPQNGIADSFDANYTDADRSGNGDNETGPGANAHNGDGLTYWEEYRGVDIKGTWTVLSPTVKDIFAYSDFDGAPAAGSVEAQLGIDAPPVGYATNLPSDFSVHVIDEDDALARRINFRYEIGKMRMNQEAIVIDEFTAEPTEQRTIEWIKQNYNHPTGEVLGVAKGKWSYNSPNAPAGMKPALIFTIFLKRSSLTNKIGALNNTIAHELGHCISLEHSGNPADIMADPNTVAAFPAANYVSQYIASQHTTDYRLIPVRRFGAAVGFQSLSLLPSDSDNNGNNNAPPLKHQQSQQQQDANELRRTPPTTRQTTTRQTTTTPPAMRPCGVHPQSTPGDHTYGRCTTRNELGQQCTGSRAACQSHSHSYPAAPPPPTCGARSWTGCTQRVRSSRAHRIASCPSGCGNTIWTCHIRQMAWHTETRTCRRPGCRQTFTKCNNGTCTSNWGTRETHWAQ